MARLTPTTDRRGGFTLAESLIASVVLAIAVIGVATTLSASHAHTATTQIDSRAVSLARQLMEEIAAKPLLVADATPGWPSESDRAKFDSVNDYDGYQDGTPLSMLNGDTADVSHIPFTRIVTIHQPATLFGTTPIAGDFVIVEVAARDSNGRGAVLRRLVSRTTMQR